MPNSLFQSPTLVLILLNLLAFIFPYLIPIKGYTDSSFFNFLELGRKDNLAILSGEYYRLITSTFLHADLLHLLFNMYSLWNIGPIVQSQFNLVGFLLIYFLSGLAGSLTSFFFNPAPSVGASGAIFGLVGSLMAYGLFYRDTSLVVQIAIILAINFLYTLNPGSQIDNFGHLGGLVMGFLTGYLLLDKNLLSNLKL